MPVSGERVTVSRTIAAPAARIWELVSHPQGHVDIDGSGMLEAAEDARPLTTVGDTFDIKMDRTPLNDIPGLVKYEVRNTVTRIEPEALIEWGIGGKDSPPLGHVYAWQLSPSADGSSTEVTHYCDWSNINDQLRAAGREWPIVPEHMLEQSLDKLERLVTAS
jgi:uncharacterized protein YndB with AHSA1/START domain